VGLLTDTNRKWWALGAVSFSLFMIMLDNTVVTVALRAIQKDLNTNLSQLEWIVNAYSLTFAVFLITAGKLADFLGRRRIFLAGLVLFTLASLWCALSPSGGVLIAARAVQGCGAALMLPATLSVITALFPVRQRGMALGIWAAISGAALAIGPLVGGALVEGASWPWIFYINIPIGTIGILMTLFVVPESRDTSEEQRLDLGGLLISGQAIFLLTFALIEANRYGWSAGLIVLCFVGAAEFSVAFVLFELRQRLPMIDLSLFRNPTFTGANAVGFLMFMSLFGLMFYMSLYLQTVILYSALKTGVTFISATVAIMLMAPISGKLSDRVGSRWLIALGMTTWGVALFMLSSVIAITTQFWDMFPWFVLAGCGFGLVLPPATAAALAAVPIDKAGVGAGVLQALRQMGGALGVAISGAIVAAQTSKLTYGLFDARYDGYYITGMKGVLIFSGAVAIGGAVVAIVAVRSHAPVADAAPAEATSIAAR
jgi:EmrB/QacA subfamily drug resistance transporter